MTMTAYSLQLTESCHLIRLTSKSVIRRQTAPIPWTLWSQNGVHWMDPTSQIRHIGPYNLHPIWGLLAAPRVWWSLLVGPFLHQSQASYLLVLIRFRRLTCWSLSEGVLPVGRHQSQVSYLLADILSFMFSITLFTRDWSEPTRNVLLVDISGPPLDILKTLKVVWVWDSEEYFCNFCSKLRTISLIKYSSSTR